MDALITLFNFVKELCKNEVKKDTFVITYDENNGVQHDGKNFTWTELNDAIASGKTVVLQVDMDDIKLQTTTYYIIPDEGGLLIGSFMVATEGSSIQCMFPILGRSADTDQVILVGMKFGSFEVTWED